MNDDKKKEIDEKVTEYYVEENERKYPSFIVLLLLTTFAVIAALGLSFSTITLLEGNQTINTLISRIKGENDDKERYIVTYVENTGPYKDKGIYLINQFPTSDSKGKLFEGENYVFHFSLLLGSKTKNVYVPFKGYNVYFNTYRSANIINGTNGVTIYDINTYKG